MAGADDGVRALVAWLERLGRQAALDLVRPPLPAEAVHSALTGAGVPAVQPVLDWFAAWDGQEADGTLGHMDVLPGFYALSLTDALRHKEAQTWPEACLPLLTDGGGDFYVADASQLSAPVLRHRYDELNASTVAPSLEAFIGLAVRAFDERIIFVDGEYLEQDEDAWRSLLGIDG